MIVLVTGGAGFIGGYVTEELRRRGHVVRVLDNLSRYGSARHLKNLTVGDVKDPGTLNFVLRGCDHLVAAAAMVGGIEYFHRLPYDLLAENDRITAATCDVAIRAFQAGTLKKVTWLSSSMVYESTDHWPSREGDELLVAPPRSSYGFSKLAVEYYARAAWEQYGLPYTIVRPFNCVGTGEGSKMAHVVPDLVRKVLSGQDPLKIYGFGSQIRHYTYGGDLASGIADAVENPAALNEDLNLASPHGTTVIELAQVIWEKLRPGEPLRYQSEVPFEHDVQRRIPDTSKARKILGWEATTPLGDMIDKVIEAIRNEPQEARA